MSKIKPEELQTAIMKQLTDYKEDIEDEVIEVTDQVTKEAKTELINTSPKSGITRGTKYYKGWAIKQGHKTRNGSNKFTKIIWNKTNYQLTHLLEFGHATRDGERTSANPHIRPVEEKYSTKFADLLSRRIRRVSR